MLTRARRLYRRWELSLNEPEEDDPVKKWVVGRRRLATFNPQLLDKVEAGEMDMEDALAEPSALGVRLD